MVRMMMYPLIVIAAGSSVDLFKQTDRRRLDAIPDMVMNQISKFNATVHEMWNEGELNHMLKNTREYLQNHTRDHGHIYCLLFPDAKHDVLVKALTEGTKDLNSILPFLDVATKYILYANVVTYMGSFLTIPGFNWLLRLVFGKWFVLFFASNLLSITYWWFTPKHDFNNDQNANHRSLKYPAFVMSYVVVQIADTVTYMLGFGPLKWINNILSVGFHAYYFLNFMFVTAFPVYASLHQVDGENGRFAPLLRLFRGIVFSKKENEDTEGTSIES